MLDYEDLQYIPKPKFLRTKKIMVIADSPLQLEIKKKVAFSSQSAESLFRELSKTGINRLSIHAAYLFPFRPEKGDLSALFHYPGLPVSEYTAWNKKDSILNFAYNDLRNLREEIREVSPDLIICTGRWGLYFLTGETTLAETKKSPWGTLLKWRASHLKLQDFWAYEKPHIVIPILPPTAIYNLPSYKLVAQQDYLRCGFLGKAALEGRIEEFTEEAQGYEFIVEPTFQEVKDFLITELLRLEKEVCHYAVDIETRQGYHDCVGIAVSKKKALCIPWATETKPHYWSEAEEAELIFLLHRFLTHPNCRQYGQNYWYDMQYFWRDLGAKVKPEDDSMVLQHTMFAGMEKNLAFICSLYAKYYRFWKDENTSKKGVGDRKRWIYNCKDCCWTFEVTERLKHVLSKSPDNIKEAYRFQIKEVLPTLVNIMQRGVKVNLQEKQRLYKELTALMEQLKGEMDAIVGEPFNPNSTPQKKALFYDLFGLPTQYDPKTKRPTLSGQALFNLAQKYPLVRPMADRVSEYGNLKTFSSTFLKAKPDIDNRMRTSYNMCGTDTFRLSSSENAFGSGMNLQNVPKGGTTALGYKLPNCRALFIPDEGKTFFDIDLDSADLRIVVAESGATGLQEMLDAGLKPYVEMMKEFYKDPTKSKHSTEYKMFKGLAHGSNYLGSAGGLAARLGLLVHEVDALQKWYFGRNPEIAEWHKELKKQVYGRGWIENIFGFRKYFFDKSHPTLMQVAAAWKPQSSVGILINKGMTVIERGYQNTEHEIEVLLQVHDSLGGQFPAEKPESVEIIKSSCEVPLPYETEIIIPVDIVTSTKSWGDCD